jgi:hypothetical protein
MELAYMQNAGLKTLLVLPMECQIEWWGSSSSRASGTDFTLPEIG